MEWSLYIYRDSIKHSSNIGFILGCRVPRDFHFVILFLSFGELFQGVHYRDRLKSKLHWKKGPVTSISAHGFFSRHELVNWLSWPIDTDLWRRQTNLYAALDSFLHAGKYFGSLFYPGDR